MKIYMSKCRDHWISPYTIIQKVIFWKQIDFDDPVVERVARWLAPVSEGIQKILNVVHPQIEYVKIDYWDTWNMDSSLSPIILPMLKQLKEHGHGAGFVDDKDVPKHLRSTAAGPKKNKWDTDDLYFDRWRWVLDEMIWAFEQLCDEDNDAQFHTGECDIVWEPSDVDTSGKPITYEMKRGPKDTRKFDSKGYMKHHKRIRNGTSLFGKYYCSLWD